MAGHRVMDTIGRKITTLTNTRGFSVDFTSATTVLVEAVMDPIEELSKMVAEARKYFSNFSEKQRRLVKDMIRTLRSHEHESNKLEEALKEKIFNTIDDGVSVFHLIRLAEIIRSIASIPSIKKLIQF